MITRRTAVGLVAAAAAAATGLPFAPAAARDPVVIEIRRFKYAPERRAVRAGDVVVWKNLDIVPHTATAKDGSWDSGTIKSGGEWKMTVTEATVGDYYCRHHPSMVASLDIVDRQ